MHVSSSQASNGASALWSLLSSRAAQASARSSSTASSNFSADASTSSTAASTAATSTQASTTPSRFELAQSTTQFAGCHRGPPPGEDPIASLDADTNGSVSAEEFGLDGASDEVKALFQAIDGDGSGDLSTDEIDSFREQMMAADQAAGGPPMGPPPGPPPGASPSGSSEEATTDSTASAASQRSSSSASVDVGAFIQQLASRYASLAGESGTASLLSASA